MVNNKYKDLINTIKSYFLKGLFLFKKIPTFKRNIIIFVISLIFIIGFYLLSINSGNSKDTMLLVHTINKLQKDIASFQSSSNTLKDKSEIKGKIDPSLVKEFREDEEFLQTVIKLKKEKMLEQLAIDVKNLKIRRMEQERSSNPQPRSIPMPAPRPEPVRNIEPPQKQDPNRIMRLVGANESNQSALIIIEGGRAVSIRAGNIISNYKLINVTRNYIQIQDLNDNTIHSIYMQQGG